MGTRSLQSDDTTPRRKRSFTLPSFRKTVGEQQSVDTSASAAEDAARIRKAAAWQWHTRGVGDVVLPTKRPITASGAPAAPGKEAVECKPVVAAESGIEKKPAESRFKSEANARGRPPDHPPLPTPAPAAPSPLYDEVELSGLKTQMADFVQRLHQKRPPEPQILEAKPQQYGASDASQLQVCPSALAAADIICRSSSSSAKVSGFRPISTLRKFFRKVMFGKSNPAPPATLEPEVLQPEVAHEELAEADDAEHHYHHYIHHHHHHYHYGRSPNAEEEEFSPRRRRHSESSGFRPRIPPLIWEENEAETEEEEEEASPIAAFLARRRRHSDSAFAEYISKNKPDAGAEFMKRPLAVKPAKPSPELQLPRRLNSERFSTGNKVPKEGKDDLEVREGALWQSVDKSGRRRHSAGSFRDGGRAEMRRSMEEARAARGGGGAAGGVYKLSGAGANYESMPAVLGRRHPGSFDSPRRRAQELVREELLMRDDSSAYDLKGWLRTQYHLSVQTSPARPYQ